MKKLHINKYKEVVTYMVWFSDRITTKKPGIQLKYCPGKYLHEVVIQEFDKLFIKSRKMKNIKK